MKMKKSILIQVLSLSLSPIIGTFISVVFSINRKMSPFVLSFSLSLILIYMPLMYDVSAGFFAYIDYENGNIVKQLHLINVVASFIDDFFGLDYFYLVFMICFISIYLWFKTYENIISQSNSKYLHIFIFSIFFLLLTYKELMDLNRTFFSYTIAMYAIITFHLGKMKGYLKRSLLILSLLIHPSSLVIVLSYVASKYIRLSKSFFLLLLFFSLLLGANFELLLAQLLPFVPAETFLQTYLSNGKWGIVSDYELGRLILYFIQGGLISACLLLAFTNVNDRLSKTFLFLAMFFFVFIKFRVFGERFFLASTLCIPFLLVGIRQVNMRVIIILCFAFLKFFSYNLYIFGYIFTSEFNYVIKSEDSREIMMIKPLYMPTIYLLNIGYFGYSNEFIKVESKWKIEQYNNSLSGNK